VDEGFFVFIAEGDCSPALHQTQCGASVGETTSPRNDEAKEARMNRKMNFSCWTVSCLLAQGDNVAGLLDTSNV
jgi:hypothetical protein